jgi:predicted O-methyltransferase YrrM
MPTTLKRLLKTRSKNFLRSAFEIGQRFHIDVLPRHFYSEIPDIRTLRATTSWRKPRSFQSVLGDIDSQVAWIDACTKNYRDALKPFAIHKSAVKMNTSDEGYGEVEADFLYCFIRSYRPKQIVQIGCGVSTAVCLLAAQDEGYSPHIVCIEPYPTTFLQRESKSGRIDLVPQKVQDVGSECVQRLGAGDLFFVDSSHSLAPAGELNLIVLEMLPRLAPGVYAHFHDIYFPYDYSPDVLTAALFFSHETALLYAFLLMNRDFEIAGSLSMLHHQRSSDLRRILPDIHPAVFEDGLTVQSGQFPSAIFLRRLAEWPVSRE